MSRASWPASVLWALAALAGPAAAPASVPVGFAESTVASGLTEPTAIAFLPDGRLLVTEKGGALRLVDGAANPTLVYRDPSVEAHGPPPEVMADLE
jgi:glucose/arabinose dehydrogenase